MSDVFVSYARDDLVEKGGRPFLALRDEPKCMVRRIEAALNALKIDVWRDTQLLSGQEYQREINAAIQRSKVLLVCWSPSSVASDFVRAEADFARVRNKLVAVLIRSAEIPVPFNLIQSAPLMAWNGNIASGEWLTTVKGLSKLLGRPGLPEYCELLASGTPEGWTQWLTKYTNDPLAQDALEHANRLHRESLARLLKPASSGTNSAGNATEEEENVIYSTSPKEIAEFIQDMGYRATIEELGQGGRKVVRTKMSGFSVTVFLYGDDQEKSTSLQLYSGFKGDAGCTTADLNAVNADRRYTKIYLDKDNDLVIEADILLRGGIHADNLRVQIELFESGVSSLHSA